MSKARNISKIRSSILFPGLFLLVLFLTACGGGGGGGGQVTPQNNGNTAPTISGTPATAVSAGTAYGFTPTSGDTDGDTLLFSMSGNPAWLSINTATGQLTGTPSLADLGATIGIVITVDDQQGEANSVASLAPFNLTVSSANVAPTISGTPPASVLSGVAYSFTPTSGDTDGDTLLFSMSNNPAWLNINPATGALSGTPTLADVGTTNGIVITVNDQQGAPNSTASLAPFNLTVFNSSPNNAPTIGGVPAAAVAEDSAYSFTPTSGDVDGDTLLFSMSGNPAWLIINPATGALSGTPTNADVGTTNGIVITVDDQQGAPNSTASLAAFSLTVTNTNDAPTIGGVPFPTVAEDSAYSFTPTSGDVDGDTLLFSMSGNPAWLTINPGTGALSGTPTNADVGTTNGIVITVDDQQGAPNSTASLAAFSLTVTNTNDAPTISGTPASSVGAGAVYSFFPTAGDVDGDTLLFSMSGNPAWLNINPATGALSGTPTLADVGTTNGIVITVDDQRGAPNSTASLAAFSITVTASIQNGFNEALFAEPTASTVSGADMRRLYMANDGQVVAGNGWVGTEDADDTLASASIRLTFDSTKTISRVELSDDLNLATQLMAGSINFSDGSSVPISAPLPDDGTPQSFVFSPRQTDWVEINLTEARNNFGLAEIAAYSDLDPGQTEQFSDLFNDGDASGWTVVDNCLRSGSSHAWDPAYFYWTDAGNQYQQTGNCRGLTALGGVEMGSYARLESVTPPSGVDLRLRLRSDNNGATWVNGPIGILFGYQNDTNYYRLDISQAEGHRKLWKNAGGVFTELVSSPQSLTPGVWPSGTGTNSETSYSPEAWINLRVVHTNGVILVYVNGQQVLAAADTTYSGGKVALLCARNEFCTFDNVIVLDPPSNPMVGIQIDDSPASGPAHASGEFFVSAGSNLDVVAPVTEVSGFDRVEFVIDEGLPGEVTQLDFVAPYAQTFSLLSVGDHTVRTYLQDSGGQRLGAATEAPQVGTGGIHLVGLGDSITSGQRDDIFADDTSLDSRNTAGGYQSVLNDLLRAENALPVTLLNEGNSGEKSGQGADRIQAVLARTPEAQGYLVMYGANDARSSLILPSGLGLDPGDLGYAGSFKDNMERIFSAILAEGKQVLPGKTIPKFVEPSGLPIVVLNTALQEFNDVVDELLLEKGITGYTAPDFYAYMIANQSSEMDIDGIHPNGTGYQSMARGWCESLSGQLGLVCTETLF